MGSEKKLEWREVKTLPKRCIECDKKAKIYLEANEEEQKRMELEEDFSLDCGSCDYALERYYAVEKNL
jgi:hypothetical protein